MLFKYSTENFKLSLISETRRKHQMIYKKLKSLWAIEVSMFWEYNNSENISLILGIE